ncbi:MAG: hypothetical protein GF328_02240 [Candidatus Latescibacteria bacterium]|nr:hypothetical protein [Candidatus Latescibacterota bacterium]
MRSTILLVFVVALALQTLPVSADDSAPVTGVLGQETLLVMLEAGAFDVLGEPDEVRLEMEGFGHRAEPGKPHLPEKRFLLALPPGARVRSIESTLLGASDVPGVHRVAPSGPIDYLVEPGQLSQAAAASAAEWQHNYEAVYGSDVAYPPSAVRLVASGSLRKYAYASVAFCPFRYHPQSGRLIRFESAAVTINYDLPEPGSAESREVEVLAGDTVADERAARLFANFEQIEPLYVSVSSDPDLRGFQETFDYIILTTPSLAPSVESSLFPSWKETLGFNVRILLTTDPEIAAQPGDDLAARIRSFLREKYAEWGIQYLLIAGGIDEVPMRYCYPDPNDHAHNPSNPSNPGGSVPTDYYYADLSRPDTDSWDSDGDGYPGEYWQDDPDFLAEISVGRIPTGVPGRLEYTLEKIVTFEQDTGAWKSSALHPAAILYYEHQDHRPNMPKIDGARCPALIEADFMPAWPLEHWSEQDGLDPSEYPWSALSMQAFIDAWRSGRYGVVNWSGHGNPGAARRFIWAWDDGDGICETDGSDTVQYPAFIDEGADLDDDYPSIVFSLSCSLGYPESNSVGQLGIDLVTAPGFGAAVAIVAGSRGVNLSRYWPDEPGASESICYEFNRFLLDGPNGPERLGDALYDAKFYANSHYSLHSWTEHQNLFSLNLYGDPALVRAGVENPAFVADPSRRPPQPYLLSGPNPSSGELYIRFDLPEPQTALLQVFDAKGARVRRIVHRHLSAGTHAYVWDGRDQRGTGLPSGTYLLRLTTSTIRESRRAVLVR